MLQAVFWWTFLLQIFYKICFCQRVIVKAFGPYLGSTGIHGLNQQSSLQWQVGICIFLWWHSDKSFYLEEKSQWEPQQTTLLQIINRFNPCIVSHLKKYSSFKLGDFSGKAMHECVGLWNPPHYSDWFRACKPCSSTNGHCKTSPDPEESHRIRACCGHLFPIRAFQPNMTNENQTHRKSDLDEWGVFRVLR